MAAWHRGARSECIGFDIQGAEDTPSPPSSTHYQYTPTGELETITDAGDNVASMTYDLLGRRLSLDNPDIPPAT